jgi:alpha-tubulin suppressor-like RCC1 family protein
LHFQCGYCKDSSIGFDTSQQQQNLFIMDYKLENMISCGSDHAAVITPESRVVCWGSNAEGQCNVPTELNTEVVVAISCGTYHSAALTAQGKVVCWGKNDYGCCEVPAALGNVIAVSCGSIITAVLTQEAGSVVCWGSCRLNFPAELGRAIAISCYRGVVALLHDGTIFVSGVYDMQSGLHHVIAVSAGFLHVAALSQDGRVYCLGTNSKGRCAVPSHLDNVVAVSCGINHTAALTAEGCVFCWGSNDRGQCDVPDGLKDVVAISSYGCNTVALTAEGKVVCWGDNRNNQCNVPNDISVMMMTNILL